MRPSFLISSLDLHHFWNLRSKLLGNLLMAVLCAAVLCAAFSSAPLAAAEILDTELVAATEAVEHAFAVPSHHRVSAELLPLDPSVPGAAPDLTWLAGPCAAPGADVAVAAAPDVPGTAEVCVLRIRFATRHDGLRFRLRLRASPIASSGPDEVDEDSVAGGPFPFSPGQPVDSPSPVDPDEVDEDS